MNFLGKGVVLHPNGTPLMCIGIPSNGNFHPQQLADGKNLALEKLLNPIPPSNIKAFKTHVFKTIWLTIIMFGVKYETMKDTFVKCLETYNQFIGYIYSEKFF